MSKRKIKPKPAGPDYPAATLVFYGPDDKFATKAVATIIEDDHSKPTEMRKWFSEEIDIRENMEVGEEIFKYLEEHGVKQTLGPHPDQIMGCPHEEGMDYPKGEECPNCPFWASKNDS